MPIKELKRRTKVEALEKLVYLVLVQENEWLLGRRLRGFAEIQLGSYHASGHISESARRVNPCPPP